MQGDTFLVMLLSTWTFLLRPSQLLPQPHCSHHPDKRPLHVHFYLKTQKHRHHSLSSLSNSSKITRWHLCVTKTLVCVCVCVWTVQSTKNFSARQLSLFGVPESGIRNMKLPGKCLPTVSPLCFCGPLVDQLSSSTDLAQWCLWTLLHSSKQVTLAAKCHW